MGSPLADESEEDDRLEGIIVLLLLLLLFLLLVSLCFVCFGFRELFSIDFRNLARKLCLGTELGVGGITVVVCVKRGDAVKTCLGFFFDAKSGSVLKYR